MRAPAEKTEQVAYKLPPNLIVRVKHEAADRNCYPAHVVRSILTEHFAASERRPFDSPSSLPA